MSDSNNIVFWLSLLPSVVFFGYIIQRYVVALRSRPNIAKEDIVYQERFASGASQKNVLTKLGVRDRVQAVVVAYESGLITPGSPD